MNLIQIRTYREKDLPTLKHLYFETITDICSKDYSKVQIEIWRATIFQPSKWENALSRQQVFVAELSDKIVGFGSLEKNLIDKLFVHKNFQNQGIAQLLYQKIENEALKIPEKFLQANVSLTAKKFFLRQGFSVREEQEVILEDVVFKNFLMEKSIS